ncbi:synaptonemal complex central element protein 2 isoform X3 [Bos taurus]|uniref:synaptonemal complex central element protein 2 isoform X3 n=1 Tax=Bos taurus TaxID=9913 RepID=UPI0028CB7167|nr:synaptonemal complex central element protein 2 isoform X3 [Bos taurus]
MARGRSRVEKDSDTHAPHPFLFFFSYFSLLEGLEPTYTPIRSPGTLAPQQETQASPRPLQVSPPQSSCAPGTGSPPRPRPRPRGAHPSPAHLSCRSTACRSSTQRVQGPGATAAGGEPGTATGANRQLMMLEGKSGPYFSSLDSSIDMLKKRAQELIENINESRQKDHALMTNFRDSLKIKVSDLTEKLEERMYQIYNHHNKIIQEKLQEFTQKMAKISHLETELKQVCHTVETVYKDLCVQPEATTLEEEQIHKDGEC